MEKECTYTRPQMERERARKEKKRGEREKRGRKDTVAKKKQRKSTTLTGVCRCNTRVPRVAGRLASRVAK